MSRTRVLALRDCLVPISRRVSVCPDATYPLLGVRLDGKGPFLRETVCGGQTSATSLYRVEAGDFVYSRLFAWRGAFGVVPEELSGCYVSSEFPTFRVVGDVLDISYLNYWFQLPRTLRKVFEDCTGSTPLTRNRYKENFFLSLEIPLPPIADQQRFVAYIDALAEKIDQVETLQRQVLQLAGNLPSSLHAFHSSKRVIRLGSMLQLDERRVTISPDASYPQVGIRAFGEGLFPKNGVQGSATTYRYFHELYTGAVVLSQVKGWEGAVAVCPPTLDGWFVSPEYRTFRCDTNIVLPEYMAMLVPTPWFWSKLANLSRGLGGRRERTRPAMFLNLEIEMPDLAAQGEALRSLAVLPDVRNLQTQTAAQLDALMPAVLDKAFMGAL